MADDRKWNRWELQVTVVRLKPSYESLGGQRAAVSKDLWILEENLAANDSRPGHDDGTELLDPQLGLEHTPYPRARAPWT